MWLRMFVFSMFQHTAARRRLAAGIHYCNGALQFQHTAARRRLVAQLEKAVLRAMVSTHSRPKAAGCGMDSQCPPDDGFNTQPPEGGWSLLKDFKLSGHSFNTQPPEGGWHNTIPGVPNVCVFQHTAARRRLGLVFDIL